MQTIVWPSASVLSKMGTMDGLATERAYMIPSIVSRIALAQWREENLPGKVEQETRKWAVAIVHVRHDAIPYWCQVGYHYCRW